MSIESLEQIHSNAVKRVAENMMLAAKTAPKGRGIEKLHYLLIAGEHLQQLANTMRQIAAANEIPFFARDAGNVEKSSYMLLIGASNEPRQVALCHHCGFGCKAKPTETPCAITQADLGIAIGSAVSLAANFHIDNRIMYSAGVAAVQSGFFPVGISIAYGIPVHASEKSIFFDR